MYKNIKNNSRTKLAKLLEAKNLLETHEFSRNLIQDWKQFELLSEFRQIVIRNEWEEYYKKIPYTITHQRFIVQQELFYIDEQKVKDYAEDATLQRINQDYELQQPIERDPWEYDYSHFIREYKRIESDIKEAKFQTEEGIGNVFT